MSNQDDNASTGDSVASAESSSLHAAKAQRTPEGKKFRFVPNTNRKGKKQIREFQSSWKRDRDWLQFDPEKGMWCNVCFHHRDNPKVFGPATKRNALVQPTKKYDFKVVKRHAEGSYHLTACGLEKALDTPVAQLPICLPTAVIPQVQVLLRTVLYMARTGLAHRQLGPLFELQQQNGSVYNLGYASRYATTVMRYLARAADRLSASAE